MDAASGRRVTNHPVFTRSTTRSYPPVLTRSSNRSTNRSTTRSPSIPHPASDGARGRHDATGALVEEAGGRAPRDAAQGRRQGERRSGAPLNAGARMGRAPTGGGRTCRRDRRARACFSKAGARQVLAFAAGGGGEGGGGGRGGLGGGGQARLQGEAADGRDRVRVQDGLPPIFTERNRPISQCEIYVIASEYKPAAQGARARAQRRPARVLGRA